jgi:hypothetical protein
MERLGWAGRERLGDVGPGLAWQAGMGQVGRGRARRGRVKSGKVRKGMAGKADKDRRVISSVEWRGLESQCLVNNGLAGMA